MEEEGAEEGAEQMRTLKKFQENCNLFVRVVSKPDSQLTTTLTDFVTWINWINQGAGSKEHETFFYKTAMPQMATAVLKRYYKSDQLQLVNEFLQSLIKALVSRLRLVFDAGYSDPEMTTLVEILRPQNSFYYSYGQEEAQEWRRQLLEAQQRHDAARRGSHQDVQGPSSPLAPDHDAWLDAFDEGDMGYVLSDFWGRWMPCRVLQVSPTNTEVQVEILELGDDPSVVEVKWLPKEPKLFRPFLQGEPGQNSGGSGEAATLAPVPGPAAPVETEETANSAPVAAEQSVGGGAVADAPSSADDALHSESDPQEAWADLPANNRRWLESLSAGDMCDAQLKEDGNWYQAIVAAVEPACSSPDPAVGPKPEDILLLTYVGFLPSQDTRLPRSTATQLAPLNSKSFGRRGLQISKAVDTSYADYVVDDENDDENELAVMRFSRNTTTSSFLVSNVEFFAHIGGPETILAYVERYTGRVDLLRHALCLFAGICTVLSRSLVEDVLPRFLDLVANSLEQMDQAQVRQFSKPVVSEMLERVAKVAHRCMPRREAAAFVEKVAVLLAGKRLQSPAIMQRLDGMDLVSDLIDRVANAEVYPAGLAYRQRTISQSEMGSNETATSSAAAKARAKDLISSVLVSRSLSFDMQGPQEKPNSDLAAEVRFAAPAEGPSTPKGASITRNDDIFSTPPRNKKRDRAADDSTLPSATASSSVALANNAANNFEYARVPVAWNLNKSLLAAWIIESRAIESAVRGPLAHSEMAKRATRLLLFLSRAESISDDMLARIWGGVKEAKGSDRELAEAILRMVAETVSSLSLAQTEEVLRLFKADDAAAQASPKALEVLREICKSPRVPSQPASRPPSIQAAEVLFDLALSAGSDSSPTARALADSAIDELRAVVAYHASLDMMRVFKKTKTDSDAPVAASSENLPRPQPQQLGNQAALLFSNVLTAAQLATAGCGLDEHGQTLREVLIGRALSRLEDPRVVLPALQALQVVLHSYPRRAELGVSPSPLGDHLSGGEAREDVVEWLERHHDLINVCFQSCRRLCADQARDVDKHAPALMAELDFVLVLLSESNLVLSEVQIRTLWDALVANNEANEGSSAACFRFLAHCATDQVATRAREGDEVAASPAEAAGVSLVGLDEATLRATFDNLIGNLDLWQKSEEDALSEWPPAALTCLQLTTLQLNRFSGRVSWTPPKVDPSPARKGGAGNLMYMGDAAGAEGCALDLDSVKVLEPDGLEGENVLRYLALHARSEDTARRAADTLCRLHLGAVLAPDALLQYREAFVNKCMSELQEATEAVARDFARGSCAAIRSLGLVRPLLELTERQTAILCDVLGSEAWKRVAPHAASTVGQSFEVTVSNNFRGTPGHNTKSVIMVSTKEPVWKLREQVANCLELESTRRLRIFAGGKEIKLEAGALLTRDVHGISPGVTILACEKPPAAMTADAALRDKVIGTMVNTSSDDLPEVTRPDPCMQEQEQPDRAALARKKLSALPSVILASNKRYSEILFQLLDACAQSSGPKLAPSDKIVANALSADVWRLLQALPSNESLKHTDRLVSEVSKEAGSLLKLLYVVELAEALFASEDKDMEADARRFIEADGVHHLVARLTEMSLRGPVELGESATLGFRATQLLSVSAKLVRLSFFIIAAYVEKAALAEAGPGAAAAQDLVLGLMPRMTTIVRLQKEVDLSGLVMMDITTAFPFAPLRPTAASATVPPSPQERSEGTDAVEVSKPSSLPELASLRHALGLLGSVVGRAEAEVAARAAQAALQSYILSPLDPKRVPADLLPDVKRSLLVMCAFGVGSWALSSLTGVKTTDDLLVYLQNGLARADGLVPTITRFAFRNAVQRVARLDPELGATALTSLALVRPPLHPATACDQYFALFEQLVRSPYLAKRASRKGGFLGPLVESVRLALASPDTNEQLFEGYLHILSCVMAQTRLDEAAKIADLLLTDCLFQDASKREGTAGTLPIVRRGAFKVLAETVISHPSLWPDAIGPRVREESAISLRDLYDFQAQKSALGPYVAEDAGGPGEETPSEACWSIELGSDLRAPCGFVGLVNLGFICYMNSLVQQVFNTPRLRYGVLRARLAPAEGSTASEGGHGNADGAAATEDSGEAAGPTLVQREILQELQRMMVALDLSVKQAYNPTGWCQAFKDEQGQPVNLFEQQDAHEFFNSLCDRIDEMLQKVAQPKLMSDAIGVSIANQLICVDPSVEEQDDGVLQRENPSVREYCLTQELGDGIGSLHDSLRNFVAGEVINDYSWEERGNAKLRTLKRQCIAELSDVVFVHLKRFRLNWATLMTEKINSRFEFPLEIDFFPYTKDGLEWKGAADDESRYGPRGKAYYEFELAGVVVHSGASLNSGHYYSYIRSRFGPGAGEWFEFNDRIVRPFDLSTLEEATFGGGSRVSSYGIEIPSVSNAYMLVYERKLKVQDEAHFMGPEAADFVARGAGVPEAVKLRLMPEGMADATLRQNRVIRAVQRAFEPGIATLFKTVAQADVRVSRDAVTAAGGSGPDASFVVDAAVYALDTLTRSAEGRADLPDVLMGLQGLLVGQVSTARRCLTALASRSATHNLLEDLLLRQQGSEIVREGAAALLELLLAEASGFGGEPDEADVEIQWVSVGLKDFLAQLVEVPLAKGLVRANMRSHGRWWSVVHIAARHFAEARMVLAQHAIIAHVVDMFMGSASPLRASWTDFASLGPEPAPETLASVSGAFDADWSEPFKVVRELCVSGEALLDTPGWEALQAPEVVEQTLLHLHRYEQGHASWAPRETPAVSLGVIFATLSLHSDETASLVMDALMRHIGGAKRQGLVLYFAVLEQVLRMSSETMEAEISLRQPFAEVVAMHASDTFYLWEFTRLVLGLYLEQPLPFLAIPDEPEAREEVTMLPWLAGTMQFLAEHAEHAGGPSTGDADASDPELVAPEALSQSSGAETSGESDAARISQEDFELLSSMYEDLLDLLHDGSVSAASADDNDDNDGGGGGGDGDDDTDDAVGGS